MSLAHVPTMPSAYEHLPAELLLTILALARPSSTIATTCCLASNALADGQHVRLAWTHHTVFHSKLEPFYDGDPPGTYTECPDILHYPSRLAHFLRHQLAPRETLYPYERYEFGPIAPVLSPKVDGRSRILTPGLIDWLFCPNGPFSQRQVDGIHDIAHQLELGLQPLRTIIVSNKNLRPHLKTVLPHVYWKLVPDFCFLVVYFMRSGQLEHLSKILSHLVRIIPQLGQVKLPLSLWATSALDRCSEFDFFARDPPFPDRTCTLPFFFASLALIDLAQPALQIILQHFPQLSATELANGFLSHPPLVRHFKHMLAECRDVARVTHVLDWLLANRSAEQSLSLLFPVSLHDDVTVLDFSVFYALFSRFDIPHFIAPMSAEERERVAEYSEEAFDDWLRHGDLTRDSQFLTLVLEHQLLSEKLLLAALESTLDNGLDTARELILANLAHEGDLGMFFIDVLRSYSHNNNHSTRLLTILHDRLADHGLDPTTALMEHTCQTSCFFISQMLFPSADRPTALCSWDFGRIFHAWAKGTLHPDCWDPASEDHVSLIMSIADHALESPSDEYLDALCEAFSAAKLVQTIAACVHQFALSYRFVQHTPLAGCSIGHLATLLKRKTHDGQPFFNGAHLTEPELRKFKQAVAFSMSRRLPAAYSTTLDPTLDCMRYVAHHVASLDLEFVKSCVRWDKHVAPWVWRWFEQPELDRLMVNVPGVCEAFVRMEQADRNEDEVVPELVWMVSRVPVRIRKAPEFWRTVRSLVGKYPSLEAALNESRVWLDWQFVLLTE